MNAGQSSERADEAQLERAFLGRPRITIRARLIGAFGLLFLLMLGITASAVIFVSYTRSRLLFLDKAESYLFEVEQARRFEKNFFLYGSGLADAIGSVHEAEIELERNAAEFGAVLGDGRLGAVTSNLSAYSSRLAELAGGRSGPVPEGLEARVRRAGARALADAEDIVDRERLDVTACSGRRRRRRWPSWSRCPCS